MFLALKWMQLLCNCCFYLLCCFPSSFIALLMGWLRCSLRKMMPNTCCLWMTLKWDHCGHLLYMIHLCSTIYYFRQWKCWIQLCWTGPVCHRLSGNRTHSLHCTRLSSRSLNYSIFTYRHIHAAWIWEVEIYWNTEAMLTTSSLTSQWNFA